MVILVLVLGGLENTQHPLNLVGTIHGGTKSCPLGTGNKIDPSVSCKTQTCIVQARNDHFGDDTGGDLTLPQHPRNLVGMVHVGTKFCPQVIPMRQGKKIDPCDQCKSQTVEH